MENPDKTKPVWGENQWPSVPGFKEKYEIWIDKMKKLGLIVMEAQVSSHNLPWITGLTKRGQYGYRTGHDTGRMGTTAKQDG